MNVQPFQIIAIIVWGVLAVIGLFAYGAWRGAELGTLAAVGAAAATWAFQQADYQANGTTVAGFLFVLSVVLGVASAALSFIGV